MQHAWGAWERTQEPDIVYGEIIDAATGEAVNPLEVTILEQEDEEDHGQPDIGLGGANDLLEMLVARFEDSLVGREREIDALRRSLEEAQELAALHESELETTTQVLRIMERDNNRMKAQLEELHSQLGDIDALRAAAAEAEELRAQVVQLKKRRRLANEIDELRKQISELVSSEKLLEQMLRQQFYS
jgi:uncharacterized protein YhaN